MKKLATISLFVFGVIVTAVLTAGLVFYQNKKDSQTSTPTTNSININKTTTVKTPIKINSSVIKPVVNSIILSMTEIAKHNTQSDCWMLISGKVYNITNYFGSHPGGSRMMSETCGKDATDAYYTQDPNATSSSSKSAHSSRAQSLLNSYYLGDLNQAIGK